MDKKGPSVVEFNVRLGDPETQVLAVQDKRDWSSLISRQVGIHTLPKEKYSDVSKAVAVILASSGYPYATADSGLAIDAKTFKNSKNERAVFAASVKLDQGQLTTGSGRVMCVVASADSFAECSSSRV